MKKKKPAILEDFREWADPWDGDMEDIPEQVLGFMLCALLHATYSGDADPGGRDVLVDSLEKYALSQVPDGYVPADNRAARIVTIAYFMHRYAVCMGIADREIERREHERPKR